MCDTCGCDSDGGARIEGMHAHVMADGSVVHHAHHDHDHAHAHEHGHHDHAHEHDDHEHHHEPHGHAHAPPHEHASSPSEVPIEARVLARNDLAASRCRAWLDARGVTALNLMSSPGSGKTTLLERTLVDLRGHGRAASVLEGDQETTRDADRIRATGAPALQINTGRGCHLEAEAVLAGLAQLSPPQGSTLFIENVGNLVCPALFDLGEHARVVLFSVTEGEDKPLKYPHMFRAADVVLLTKVDLLPHLDFDVGAARAAVQRVRPGTPVIEVSARGGRGLSEWYAWLADVTSRGPRRSA